LDFVVFEQPEVTILSCHVEGQRMKEPQSQLLVEIKSASDSSKTETVFELPVSNFFQVKNLPKTKHLLQLRTSLQSRTHKFESEIIEVDLERTAQIHVGPLRYSFEEDHQKQVCFTFIQREFSRTNLTTVLNSSDLEITLKLLFFLGGDCTDKISLINWDNRAVVQWLPKNSVDLVYTYRVY
jgi:hypothetical protein